MQCGAEPSKQQLFGTAGVEWVNPNMPYLTAVAKPSSRFIRYC